MTHLVRDHTKQSVPAQRPAYREQDDPRAAVHAIGGLTGATVQQDIPQLPVNHGTPQRVVNRVPCRWAICLILIIDFRDIL